MTKFKVGDRVVVNCSCGCAINRAAIITELPNGLDHYKVLLDDFNPNTDFEFFDGKNLEFEKKTKNMNKINKYLGVK